MTALLQAELLKLRTTRTFVTLVAVALVVSLIFCVLLGTLTSNVTPEDARGLFTFDFSGFFILLLGIIGMSGEWRHRTITSSILASPDRVRLLGAKMVSFALAGVVLSLIVTIALMIVGSVILEIRDFAAVSFPDLIDVLWRNLLIAALMGALGVGVGAVVRNQIVAVVVVVILALVVEPLLIGLVPDVGKFAPTQGAPGGIVAFDPSSSEGAGSDIVLLAPGIAVLVMFGWIALFFALAAARLRRGDLV